MMQDIGAAARRSLAVWLIGVGCLALAAPLAAQTLVLEPVADATLYEESPGFANGSGSFLFAGRIVDGSRRRVLLRFDVAGALPAGATVTGATLTMTVDRTISGGVAMPLHRVLSAWGEGASDAGSPGGQGTPAAPGDATWSSALFPDQPWLAPGGDFSASASASAVVATEAAYQWSGAGMVADLQAWLDAPASNNGWLLLADETIAGPTAKRFASREHGDASMRPLLLVDYSVGPGPGPRPVAAPVTVPVLRGEVLGALAALLGLAALLALRGRSQ